MVKRYNRLLVAFYVISDALLAGWAFILAYGIRFESGLIPVSKGYPAIDQYVAASVDDALRCARRPQKSTVFPR